jgi:hypothetical protein
MLLNVLAVEGGFGINPVLDVLVPSAFMEFTVTLSEAVPLAPVSSQALTVILWVPLPRLTQRVRLVEVVLTR